jgi:hypothetical protein
VTNSYDFFLKDDLSKNGCAPLNKRCFLKIERKLSTQYFPQLALVASTQSDTDISITTIVSSLRIVSAPTADCFSVTHCLLFSDSFQHHKISAEVPFQKEIGEPQPVTHGQCIILLFFSLSFDRSFVTTQFQTNGLLHSKS